MNLELTRHQRFSMTAEELLLLTYDGRVSIGTSRTSLNFNVKVRDYPRFPKMVEDLKNKHGITVKWGKDAEEEIALRSRKNGTQVTSFFRNETSSRGKFIPGGTIYLTEDATLDIAFHEIKHARQWKRLVQAQQGEFKLILSEADAAVTSTTFLAKKSKNATFQKIASDFREIDAEIENTYRQAISGNYGELSGVDLIQRRSKARLAAIKNHLDSLPPELRDFVPQLRKNIEALERKIAESDRVIKKIMLDDALAR